MISFVISPHGFGHLMRQVALGEELIKQRDDIKLNYICSQDHMKKFDKLIKFHENVVVKELPSFTPQFMMKNVNEGDIETSIDNFKNALEVDSDLIYSKWEELLLGSSLVINDIESLHNPVVIKLGIPLINLSNFTWSDILNGLDANEIANKFSRLESMVDISYQLPFSTKCIGYGDNYKKIGILARTIDWDWILKTQQEYHDRKFVFFTRFGQIESLIPDLLKMLEIKNIGVIIPKEYNKYLPSSIKYIEYSIDTTNVFDLIALSKIAIGKTGYSTVSEVITGGTFYIHWTREDFIEDLSLSNALIQEGNGIRIDLSEDSLSKLLFDLIVNNIDHELRPIDNSNQEIAEAIIKLL